MDMRQWIMVIGLLAGIFLIAGCAGRVSRLEMDYGTSFRLMKLNQIAYPEAGENLEPADGFDGQAALEIVGKYRKGFGPEAAGAPAAGFSFTVSQ
jgi:hypothetical protein